jgi:bacillithiol system protein YtxJ
MPFIPLETPADLQTALDRSEREAIVLFKHSSTCPISAAAHRSVAPLADQVPVYKLVVQQARSLSAAVADELGVQHESPQAFVIRDRKPTFDASHGRVTADALSAELSAS